MQAHNIQFPFTNSQPTDYSSFGKMIQTRFFPKFQLKSISTGIIAANLIIFLLMHIVFKSGGYTSFLEWPSDMDAFLLDVQKVKSNPLYIYQALTAIFMHKNYLHIAGNTVFAIFIMYEMESFWKPSIPLGILAAFLANCLAVITLQGRFLGFSGALTAYVGMIISLIFAYCTYLKQRLGQSFCWLIVMMVILVVIVIGFGQSLLIHLFGFLFGMLLGTAFIPKTMESDINQSIGKIIKFVAIGITILVIGLVFIV